MKAALCFIISYEHILNKEYLWRQWVDANKDIINVYFHCKDFNKIKSPWIKSHCIPQNLVANTSYFHVVPAYFMTMIYALKKDPENEWFCFLTDSCVPIIPPEKFRALFFENYDKTIMGWKPAYWNIDFHKRANLNRLPSKFHLANAPWFVLKKKDVERCIAYIKYNKETYDLICSGGLANESIFAIILKSFNELDSVVNATSTITDWSRMTSPTSPHCFVEGNKDDILFIGKSLQDEKYAMFLRKVHPRFPEKLLLDLINAPEKFEQYIASAPATSNNIANVNANTIIRRNQQKKILFLDSAIMMSSILVFFLAGIIFFML